MKRSFIKAPLFVILTLMLILLVLNLKQKASNGSFGSDWITIKILIGLVLAWIFWLRSYFKEKEFMRKATLSGSPELTDAINKFKAFEFKLTLILIFWILVILVI
ncbi:MAG: hypothetical protein PHG05_01315 [Candidatus Nanoarchaeia archaeon]|nr:hypothetical protein [Candidatus Nanoarchaeia archaeon]